MTETDLVHMVEAHIGGTLDPPDGNSLPDLHVIVGLFLGMIGIEAPVVVVE